jgi:hypothetical protein
MRVDDAYPSKFLGAADLGGRPATVRINTVEMEVLDKQKKVVLTFVGKKKAFVCNKTNAKKIAELHGDEMDDWPDKLIELYPAEVEFAGDTVDAIRVRAPRTETRSSDRAAEPRREAVREPARDDRRDDRGSDFGRGGGDTQTRAYDRDTDDRPAPPPRRAANADMDDDIPF